MCVSSGSGSGSGGGGSRSGGGGSRRPTLIAQGKAKNAARKAGGSTGGRRSKLRRG